MSQWLDEMEFGSLRIAAVRLDDSPRAIFKLDSFVSLYAIHG